MFAAIIDINNIQIYKRNLTLFLLRYFYFSISLHSSIEFCSTLFLFSFFTTLHNTAHHQQSQLERLAQWNFIVPYTALHCSPLVYSTVHPVLHTILHYSTHIKCKMCGVSKLLFHQLRAVGSSENPGGHTVIHGLLKEKVLLLFLPKSGRRLPPQISKHFYGPEVWTRVTLSGLLEGQSVSMQGLAKSLCALRNI